MDCILCSEVRLATPKRVSWVWHYTAFDCVTPDLESVNFIVDIPRFTLI